ncbi:MAG: hypothetical protein M3O55_12055 [Actinomycetota bacterium]|nr:hypothetical protein [Actinomycetota bacterium]
MNGRRTRVLAAAGAIAAGLLLLSPSPAQARVAAGANCVASIVDSGHGVSARCMTWRSGLTGAGALSGTGHSYRLAPSGLICAIDGFPADCHVDSTHFWSYWHKAPGSSSWTFSSEGAGTYNPRSGETEGWAYQNGASRQPRNIAFSTICPPPPPPPKPPPPKPKPPPPPPAQGGTGTAPGSNPTAAPLPAASASVAAGASQSAGASPSASASAEPTAQASQAKQARRGSGSSSPVAPVLLTGLGLVAAAGLGTAAWRRTRKAG